jgi:hypothetical protein
VLVREKFVVIPELQHGDRERCSGCFAGHGDLYWAVYVPNLSFV